MFDFLPIPASGVRGLSLIFRLSPQAGRGDYV